MTTQIPEPNVLMYAFWDEMPNHRVAKAWLQRAGGVTSTLSVSWTSF